MAWFLGEILFVSVNYYVLSALGICIWIIYTIDHMFDAQRTIYPVLSKRHRVHQTYSGILGVIIGVLIILGLVVIVPNLSYRVLLYGSILLVFVLIYLLLIRFGSYFVKEIFAALLYTLGILAGPLGDYTESLLSVHYLIIFQVFLIAFLNLLIFSVYEYEMDLSHNFKGLVTHIGVKKSKIIIYSTYIIFIINQFYTWFFYREMELFFLLITFFIMASILFVILYFQKHFQKGAWYRLIGDAVFLLPIWYLFYGK